jgi:hypothetical protein
MAGKSVRGRSAARWAAAALAFLCVAHGLPAGAAEDSYKLSVKTLVGGSSVLVLTADQVGWFQRSGLRPGLREEGGQAEPTLVNGEPWTPEWIGPLSTRRTVPEALPVPPDPKRTFCRVLSGRGDVKFQVSLQAALVLLDDGAHDGADWYEFEVFVANPSPALEAGGGRLLQAETRVARQAASAAGTGAAADPRVARLANQEAWLAAQAAHADEYEELQQAYFAVDDAADSVQKLQQVVAAARDDVAYWEAEVAEAQDKALGRQRTARVVNGVEYDYSWNDYWYRNWRFRLDDRQRSLQAARDKLAQATQQLQAEQQRLARAQAAYAGLKQTYDAGFAQTCNTQYEQLKEDVAARVSAQQEEQQDALQQEIEGRKVPGTYTLIHNGKAIGTITLFPDGTLTTVEGEKRADYQWEITADGVLVRMRDVEWLLTPGPEDTWIGRCLGPALEIKGLGVVLRPVGR